ncbi:hypothetical protein DERF_014058 [Dermatophagoides farinae]|uniref:Uncharacterized protein n=1 Tax=Dermatophagoides farinae TaxID=6954 RepID=A0A922HGM3_DERFA|nr:hypothetical protein DERF_014058 [Dermatophagoides farinae]
MEKKLNFKYLIETGTVDDQQSRIEILTAEKNGSKTKTPTLTSQWLNDNCGIALPLVCLRISLTKLKLSITGSTAFTVNICDPSCTSACNIRPFLRPITAYILPAIASKKKKH